MGEFEKKVTTFSLTLIGIFIFFSVIMVKIDVMAQEAKVNVNMLSAEIGWENYLEEKNMQAVLEKRKENF